jgi:hypothetical protein
MMIWFFYRNDKGYHQMDKTNLAPLADRYGQLKAQVADMEKKLEVLRTEILETHEPIIEGNLFRVTVSEVTRSTIDSAALRQRYPDIAEEFSKLTTSLTVRCSSR